MKKFLAAAAFITAASLPSFAGDAAAFVDIGMSADGKTYIFGEYGKTDKTFQSYAEIYVVDVAKNEWKPGEVFRTNPSSATANKSGKETFDALKDKNSYAISKYGVAPAKTENVLYIKETGDNGRKLSFQDFEGSSVEEPVIYNVTLVPTFEGSGSTLRSSFFIALEKTDKNGTLLSRHIVGSPDIKRKGVSDYTITKIFSDKTGKNLVFVVEKTIQDSTGASVRYMVETISIK